MKYYEILYSNCFNNKYVALKACQNENEFKNYSFDGCKVIDFKETSFNDFRTNSIKHFKEVNFSVQ